MARFKSAVVWSMCIMMVIIFLAGNCIFWHCYAMDDRLSEPVMVRCELKEVRRNVSEIDMRSTTSLVRQGYYVKVKPIETVPIEWKFASLPISEQILLRVMDYSCFGLLMDKNEEKKTREHTKHVGYYGDEWLIQVPQSTYESLKGSEEKRYVDVEARCNDRNSTLELNLL